MNGGNQASGRNKRTPRSRFAVLGMLSMGLETGYAMKKHVEANLGHFWNESYGQIYPILRQLVTEGLATCQVEQPAGSRRRKRYALTPAGGDELRAWLVQPPESQPPRLELLLKLSFGERVPLEACEQLIRDHSETCDRDIAHLAGIESALREAPGRHPDQPYWLMTLRYGRAVRQAERAWCDETLEHLREIRSENELASDSGLGR
jgi:DNA-binding PadR family transcriptional regulator